MSGRIILIAEGETDVEIIRAMLPNYGYPSVGVQRLLPTGGKQNKRGISRLADQLETLIETARDKRTARDCIVVLHDADEQIQRPTDQPYEQIAAICKRNPDVKHIKAYDEIEAWLLADEGFCKAHSIKAENHDADAQPSKRFQQVTKGKTLPSILKTLNGKTKSVWLPQVLRLLVDAPCSQAPNPPAAP